MGCLLLILSLKISLTLQRNNIQSLDHKKVNMVKTAKEKTIHKAMRSADKFYTEIPEHFQHLRMFLMKRPGISFALYLWPAQLSVYFFCRGTSTSGPWILWTETTRVSR